jgi:exodeoxyribonuclease V alpha subunit
LLANTAAWASAADGDGDIVLPLRDATIDRNMPEWSEQDIAALRAEPMVSRDDTGATTPFVLDDDDRFYLWRNRRDESVVVARIGQRRADSSVIAIDEADLHALFHGRDDPSIALQRAAVRQVVGRRLFVLTGGPGTGKTTTVLRMLLMLQREHRKHSETSLAIELAAPTGKAAQRLMQALRRGTQNLLATQQAYRQPQSALPSGWHGLPAAQASTLHRLLGYDPHRNAFRRNAQDPIAADVVVVDEASMLDLAMMRSLLEALRPDATLILVGDADQLTSIAAGSVLMDLVATLESEDSGDIVRLRHSFRAEQALAEINESVRRGDRSAFAAALASAGEHAIVRPVANVGQLKTELRRWAQALATLDGVRPLLPSVDDDALDPDPTTADPTIAVLMALEALATRQLLCALREGEFGTASINALIEHQLKRAWNLPDNALWYAGRAIIVTRNDYAARLFNGDIGLCLADAGGRLRVWFADIDDNGQPGVRNLDPATVPAHDSAFAITIHKSQGSEYDHVAVLLPPDARHRILSRQLLYTGLSRARRVVELWGTQAAIDAALDQPVRRAGGLATRLRRGG